MLKKANKILLIHGFAQGVSFLPFKKSKTNEQIFPIFKKEILEKNAVVFNWALDWEINFKNFLTAKNLQKLYFKERRLACHTQTLNKLNLLTEKFQPNLIIAHSMGCYLLLNYFAKFKTWDSLNKIVFVQADINNKTKIPTNLKIVLEKQNLKIINLYCYWDQALLYSSFLHKKSRAGLTGWKQQEVKNRFVSLTDLPNPHQGFLNNNRLRFILDI